MLFYHCGVIYEIYRHNNKDINSAACVVLPCDSEGEWFSVISFRRPRTGPFKRQFFLFICILKDSSEQQFNPNVLLLMEAVGCGPFLANQKICFTIFILADFSLFLKITYEHDFTLMMH